MEPPAAAELLNTDRLSPPVRDFIAGAVSGMVGIAAGQPLDTLRVRLQQAGGRHRTAASLWRAMRASEGVSGLYRGVTYPLSTTALQNAVTFQAQGAALRLLTGNPERSRDVMWQHTVLAGCFAGAVQSTICSPVELLKIRMQLQRARRGEAGYVGPIGMLVKLLREEGPLGLARGLGTTLARDTPSYGVYFLVYHWSTEWLGAGLAALQHGSDGSSSRISSSSSEAGQQPGAAAKRAQAPPQQQQQQQQQQEQAGAQLVRSAAPQQAGWQQLSNEQRAEQRRRQHAAAIAHPAVQFTAGGLAGALAWASIYPIDVCKSRLQATPRTASPWSGALHCARDTWAREGAAGFTQGLAATMGRGFVVNAAIFAAFEALMEAL